MRLPAAVFDLDDTLIVEEEVARASLRRAVSIIPGSAVDSSTDEMVLAAVRDLWQSGPHYPLCLELGIASWEGLWASFEGCHPRLEGLRAWIPSFRAQAWRRVLGSFGIEDSVLALQVDDAYRACQQRDHRLIEGADELVRSLAGSRRLGLLTNGPPDIQRLKLQGTGLADCFDQVVISGETGIGKPDPIAFLLVTERLGVGRQNAIMIGDSWERDIVGAVRAGMRAVWLSNGGLQPEELSGVTRVRSLSNVCEVLEAAG